MKYQIFFLPFKVNILDPNICEISSNSFNNHSASSLSPYLQSRRIATHTLLSLADFKE